MILRVTSEAALVNDLIGVENLVAWMIDTKVYLWGSQFGSCFSVTAYLLFTIMFNMTGYSSIQIMQLSLFRLIWVVGIQVLADWLIYCSDSYR